MVFIIGIISAVISFAGGIAIGYFRTKKKLERGY